MKAHSDIQSQKSAEYGQIDWVGMSQIQTLVRIVGKDGISTSLPAVLDMGVDLAEDNRGIHMSRLYRLHQEQILNHEINHHQLLKFAGASLDSQKGLSKTFACKLKFNLPVETISLKSNLPGFRNYPIEIIFEKTTSTQQTWLQFEVLYSSTCPQSAGLSMEILKNQDPGFDHFPATPHAQRSRAVVQVQVSNLDEAIIQGLISATEQALGTPVQTTVKKEDEMRFAELNAENLMFCEDAARKIAQRLQLEALVSGYSIYCEHQESLHPHNASSLMRAQFQPPNFMRFS